MQEGLKTEDEMWLCCQLQLESQAAAATEERALQKKGLLQRENNHFLWKRKPVNISSNIYLPLLSPSGTNSHKEEASPIFFPSPLSHSSCQGKEETLSFGITEFSVPWPAMEVQPESAQSVCLLFPTHLASVISKVKDKQMPWYLNLGLLWWLYLVAEVQRFVYTLSFVLGEPTCYSEIKPSGFFLARKTSLQL